MYAGAMKTLESVSQFADDYDAFILDIWGVIHDGSAAYPGVVECMQKLKAAGKEIIFLSNAPRRSYKVKNVLAKFGVTEDLYKDATSSGEVAYQTLSKGSGKYLYIGPEKDYDLLDGLNYQSVEKAADADFALVTGFDEDDSTLDEKMPQIKDALANGLKMYCVNPDLLVVRQDGTRMLCAGVIGEYYRDQGGEVEFIGKPHKSVYDYIFTQFSPSIPKSRIIAVGDNLETDIIGGNNSGIDSALCLGGVLMGEETPLPELIKKFSATPTITIPLFNW